MGRVAVGLGLGGWAARLVRLSGLALAVLLVAAPAAAAADVVVDSNLNRPNWVAVDRSGDVFITDGSNTGVFEDRPNGHGYTRSVAVSNVITPAGVAVDGSGDLYIVDEGNSRVVEEEPLAAGGFAQVVVSSGLNEPQGVAVNASGDVVVADYGNNRVVEDKPNGSGGFTQSVVDSSLNHPTGVAVDASGDVFIADSSNQRVVEDKPNGSGGFTQSEIGSGLFQPAGVAVDASGDVFIVDEWFGNVVEEMPDGSGGYTQTRVDSGLAAPEGVAVDAGGDVFIVEFNSNRVVVHPAPPFVVSGASLSGTPSDGDSLHLSFEFSSPVGPLVHVYSWRRCSDQAMSQNCVSVGSDSRSYKLSSADVGGYVTATVTATDTQSQSMSSTTPVIGPVAAPGAPSVVTHAEIIGPTEDGHYLYARDYQFSSPDPLGYNYLWERCSDFAMTQNCVSVGNGRDYYLLSSSDVHGFIAATVTATDREGQSTSSISQVVGPVAVPSAPMNKTAPSIVGTPQQGQILEARKGVWTSPDTLTYRFWWERCASDGTACSPISHATHNSYQLTSADVGHQIALRVTATDQEAQSSSATSQPVGPIS